MIASACIAAQLPPSAFGIDPEDVHLVAGEIVDLLQERAQKAQGEATLARLKERTRG